MARRKRAVPQATRRRQRGIIEAALACFTETGFIDTTMEDIRVLSGASTDSIYHHFKSKDALAAAIYLEGIREYQKGMVVAVEKCTQAKSGIRAMVHYHLDWVRGHPDWARYLFQMRRAAFMASTEERIAELNQGFYARVGAWLKPHIRNGVIRRFSRDLYGSLLFGPCQEYAREWLAGRTRTAPDVAARELAEAAWRTVAVSV